MTVPWAERRSNQSILKEIDPDYSLERLMLNLKLQYFGHLMGRVDSLQKTLMPGKIEGKRRREWQRMRWLYNIINSMDQNLIKLQETVEGRGAWSWRHKEWTQLSDCITAIRQMFAVWLDKVPRGQEDWKIKFLSKERKPRI